MQINPADTIGRQQNYVKPRQSPSAQEDTKTQAVPTTEQEKPAKSLWELMQDAKEKAEEYKKKFQLPKSGVRYGDAPLTAYARLARARTSADVTAAAGYARRCIAQFKSAMRRDGDHADQIKAAINQLQKAVSRAGKKRRDLEREKLMEVRSKNSERNEQRASAQRIQQELRRRRVLRVIRESGYIREAEVDNQLQAQLSATRLELQAQAQALSGSISPDVAAQQYIAQTTAGTESPPAPEINVAV